MTDTLPPVTALYFSIGECLNAWTQVEVEISTLFMVVHGSPRREFTLPLRAAFEAVISLEARLSMIRASIAADETLAENYGPHFHSLYNKIMKSYKKRHEIAHFATFGESSEDGPIFGIKPFFTWANFLGGTGKSPLYLDQVKERTRSFTALLTRVKQHSQHVGNKKGLPLGYYVQAGDRVYPPLGPIGPTPEAPDTPPQSQRG